MAEEEEKQKIRSNIVIEILGKPKEHVDKALNMYLEKIKNDDNKIAIINEKIHEAAEQDKGFFSTFAELEIVSEDLTSLIGFCFDYMPSSVEILKPEEFSMKKSTVEDLLNDLQARLHTVDMIVKQQKNENEFLKKNLNKSVSNVILISLASGSLNKEKLSKVTGIHDKELEILSEIQ